MNIPTFDRVYVRRTTQQPTAKRQILNSVLFGGPSRMTSRFSGYIAESSANVSGIATPFDISNSSQVYSIVYCFNYKYMGNDITIRYIVRIFTVIRIGFESLMSFS